MVPKDLLADLPAFLEVADRLSFRAAAQAMDLTPAALSKAVVRLEDRLGQPLFVRTTRRVALTPAGEAFRARAAEALDIVADGMAAVRMGPQVAGRVQVSAPASLLPALGPPLAALARRHHGLTVRLAPAGADRADPDPAGPNPADGTDERACDLDLRIAPATDPARDLPAGLLTAIAVAAPAYVAQFGLPGAWTDPDRHLWLVVEGPPRDPGLGRPDWRAPAPGAILASADAATVRAAALAGAGIARLWRPLVAADLAAGRLQRILPGDDPPAVPVSVRIQADHAARPRVMLVLHEALRSLGLDVPAGGQDRGATASDATAP